MSYVWPSEAHEFIARGLAYQANAQRVDPPALDYDFWALCDRSGGEWACWPWLGTRNAAGYGQVGRGLGMSRGAYRVALWLEHGVFARGNDRLSSLVRHLCHQRACCNPAHLLLGSRSANKADEWFRSAGIDLVQVRREIETDHAEAVVYLTEVERRAEWTRRIARAMRDAANGPHRLASGWAA